MTSARLRFSFGMIVFNGEAFLREVLESIYDFAYEIIIIEGPDHNARSMAGPNGGSRDRTMDILTSFPDPSGKLKIVRGHWKNKDEQCNRFIAEATGDYIWQVDDDEVYKANDLRQVERLLLEDPEITAVSFYWQNFFKGFDRVMIADPPYEVWRLFRLRPGYRFSTHRPPTVVDPGTGAVMNLVKPLRGQALAERGLYIYHYSYVYDQQVRDKIAYHARYRLWETGAGVPPPPQWLRKVPLGEQQWRRLWMQPLLTPLRRRFDREFHYDYMEKIWQAWDRDPQGIETAYGVSPSPGPYRRTAPFGGTHPASMARHLKSAG